MKIEANIQPPDIRLNQKNQKLALRIIKMDSRHSIRSRTSYSYSSENLITDQYDQIGQFEQKPSRDAIRAMSFRDN